MAVFDLTAGKPIVLRDYQQRAIDKVRDLFTAGDRGVFLVAPTGAGKTQMFTSLIEEWVRQGANCVIAAHRGELLHQAGKTVISRGLHYGIIKAGPSTNPQAPIQIVSIDSMRSRALPFDPDYIVVDEAHLAKADRYTNFIATYPRARRLFVSATPIRTDGSGFNDIAQSLIVVSTIGRLIEHENGPYFVPPRLYTGSFLGDTLDKQVKTTAGDYNQGQLEDYMCDVKLVGDVVGQYQALAMGRKGVVFCVGIKHSQMVCEEFTQAGIRAEHLDGSMDEGTRSGILNRLHTGETTIVTNCNVLCEGWDEPSVSYIGLARPTKSLAMYIQQSGRGLRIHPESGKTDCVLIDHGQNVDYHGHILDEREWSLDGDLDKRAKKQKKKPRYCPECNSILPKLAQRCDSCGWEKVISVLQIETEMSERPQEHPIVQQFRDLLKQARQYGRRPGWAYYRLLERHNENDVKQILPFKKSMRIQAEEGFVGV